MTGLNKDNLGQINSSNDTNIEQIYNLKYNLQVLLRFIESVQTGEHPPSAGAERRLLHFRPNLPRCSHRFDDCSEFFYILASFAPMSSSLKAHLHPLFLFPIPILMPVIFHNQRFFMATITATDYDSGTFDHSFACSCYDARYYNKFTHKIAL